MHDYPESQNWIPGLLPALHMIPLGSPGCQGKGVDMLCLYYTRSAFTVCGIKACGFEPFSAQNSREVSSQTDTIRGNVGCFFLHVLSHISLIESERLK